jgi:carbohydrate-selective porin OprB
LVILGWAAVAHAEDAPSAPAGTRSLAEIPFQLVLPRGHLLGDWLGARTWLEDHGVYPSVTFVTDALGNPTGGKQQGFRGASNLGLDCACRT